MGGVGGNKGHRVIVLCIIVTGSTEMEESG